MLLGTPRPFGEVANPLVFDYPKYFNKLFKQKQAKRRLNFGVELEKAVAKFFNW